ncbi:carboxylesterase [Variovorax sp. YR750]|uniref:alpha/beta hydrolase n=1 Tax=Variovorax sp. YR750 TaxID=1884384 RepID=UPI0008D79483|nr:alpha/beta fold hydrolase [Variovorax sp. YR750]SEM05003.1 carboxylesterase [Variovorax sp. YR750]
MTTTNDIVEGGKPFLFEGNEVGVLLSHGFTGTTSGMWPLGEYLHREEGWTILAPRLKGHGETPEAMSRTSAEDWIRSLEEGLQTLQSHCKHVFMAGLSMGGCLTMYLAAKYPDTFRAVAPINACLDFGAPDFAAWAFEADAPLTIKGVGNDVKDPDVKELAYPEVPVRCIREIYGLMAVTRDMLPRVTAPTLVLVSPEDHVVPPANSYEILQKVKSTNREMVLLKNSYHVATIDFDKHIINESVRRFFKQALQG